MALGYHGRERHTTIATAFGHATADPHRVTVETINTGTANPSQDKWTGSGTFHGPIAAQGDATAQAEQANRGFKESRKFELLRQPGSGAGDVRKARGYQP
jgi:hypothetical protein